MSFQKTSLSAIASAASSLGIITNSETATREGKLVDVFTAQEKLKLFGFIPITSRVEFEIDQETNGLRRIHRPWWSFLAIKPDWGTFFQKVGPNLTITDVTWDKKSYHAGDTANIHFKIKNTGTKYFLGHYDVVWREGEKPLGYKEDFYTSLEPGESVDFLYFQPWSYECDKPIFLEIDEKNEIKETDKSDNVWQGVTHCAPTTGPDLTVNQLKMNNSFYPYTEKRIGVQNNVKYVIQNIGTDVSVKTRALMRTTGGQYLALIDVPPLAPSLQFTGEVHYTPNDCNPIELLIDTENKNTEPNEDNNYAVESPEIVDHCKKGPDMSFGIHYYTLKDGSGFKPHQNGEPLLFQVELLNSATDQTWGCAHNVTLAVYEDDKLFSTFNEGNFGFGDNCPKSGGVGGTYDHPTSNKTQKFWYPAKCGATLSFVIDPDITFSDIDRSNNTWSQPIECQ
ncbi:hypothetical protein A2Z33_06175 [Candidatus Gottesmanbacteria bacterium RBG_16_52_11]|uniref:CARDB domain-containing protein n=1 Tax=Candidatus Gottesmanbacteria bacterium RBG_16_52_11 TaxID=1798374 RepID=A0A1F5YXD2_9BACT|nr:MAG: hypothetical protein A2Z33_06175 [Candidatus Gottesmanbacteria bacterium RBG_16_52_11]